MKKYIIAPWGDPTWWKPVKYFFRGEHHEGKDPIKLLDKHVKADRIIIVAMDTLVSDLSWEDVRNVDYRFLRNHSQNVILNHIEAIEEEKVDIIIAPGKGKFLGKEKEFVASFEGDPVDYFQFVYYKLAELFVKDDSQNIEVHLDLTHGLNYSTVLIYKALKEILGLVAVFKGVKFYAYNTDPFVRGVTDILNLHIIEEWHKRKGTGIKASLIDHSMIFTDRESNNLERIKFLNGCEENSPTENLEDYKAFYASLQSAFPIATFLFYHRSKVDVKKLLSKILETYERAITLEISEEKRTLKVIRKCAFNDNFGGLVYVYTAKSLFEQWLQKTGIKKAVKNPMENGVKLKFLRRLNEEIFSKIDLGHRHRLASEFENFKHYCNKNAHNWTDWTKYKEPNNRKRINSKPSGLLARNFWAHYGFLYDYVQYEIKNGEYFLRYKPEKINDIRNFVSREFFN